MKRVIRFQRTRYLFFAFSACLFAAGIAGYILNGGFNRGVDFKSGLALQFQVAPRNFTLSYTGAGAATISIPAGEQALTAAGDFILTVTATDGTKTETPFRYADYPTITSFTEALAKVPGVVTAITGDAAADPRQLVPLVRPAELGAEPYTLNLMPQPGSGVQARLADVRAALNQLGKHDLQVVGAVVNQEFIARFEAESEDTGFQTTMQAKVLEALHAAYGADQVILKRTDFVGPRLAQTLGSQAVWLIVIALFAIMAYMMLRFPFIFALAAVLALVHDAAVMLAFAAIFRVEIDSATIAAILTILGYSINDTIVIFDRVRENQTLMRESSLETLLDASITQTLGRTVITSGATMMAVLALFLLTSGSMKNFGLLMIVGIIEGTYSTVFIASPIVLEWENAMSRRRKRRELAKYGIHEKVKPVTVEEPDAEEETDVDDAVGPAPEALAIAAGTVPAAASGEQAEADAAGEETAPEASGATAPGAGPVVRDQGSHRHRRRKRRHH
jgi:preprotein translocase subunit SecF